MTPIFFYFHLILRLVRCGLRREGGEKKEKKSCKKKEKKKKEEEGALHDAL